MKKSALVLAFAMAASVMATPANAVVYGEEIESASSKYPWVASVWHSGPKDDYYYPICSGSLITQDAVLTAAHCLTKKGTYLVQMGSDLLDGESEDTFYEVASIWKHPFYDDESLDNDVGLLKLTTHQTKVKPMSIANWADIQAVKNAKRFELLGWGYDEFGHSATFLGYAKLNNQTKKASTLFRNYDLDSNSMILAGRYIKRLGVYAGSGEGDSGGPLLATINGVNKVVGITSWGKNQNGLQSPTVYSNVAYQRSEIAEGLALLQRFMMVAARVI